jgi:ribosomal-protein-alanine N-acetyltransferase
MDRISRLKQPELLTNRLILRSLEPADARLIFLLRSETDASRFVDRPMMSGIEDGLRFIRRISISISEGDCMYWALVPKTQLDLIGTICLWNWEPKSKQAEISFELLEAWQGQGYMQEALHRVLDYAFDEMDLHRLEAWVHPRNQKSINLLSRNGFLPAPLSIPSRQTEEQDPIRVFCVEKKNRLRAV